MAGWRAFGSLAAGDRDYGLYRKRRTNNGGYYALKMLGKSWLLRGDYREVTGKRRGRSGRVLLFMRPKRLLRSFVLGSAALLGALYLASLMYFWEPWKALTLDWMKALAKYAT